MTFSPRLFTQRAGEQMTVWINPTSEDKQMWHKEDCGETKGRSGDVIELH